MSCTGDCSDNAVAQAFFATLEWEPLQPRRLTSRAETTRVLAADIDGCYNLDHGIPVRGIAHPKSSNDSCTIRRPPDLRVHHNRASPSHVSRWTFNLLTIDVIAAHPEA